MWRLQHVLAVAAVLAAAGLPVVSAHAFAGDSIVVSDTTLTAGADDRYTFAYQHVYFPQAAVDARDTFSVSMPEALTSLAYLVNGTPCTGGTPGAWTGCQATNASSLDGVSVSYRALSNAYPLVGNDFIVTVRDEVTGATGTGTLHVRAVADLQLFGPFPTSPTNQAPWDEIGFSLRDLGPSRSDSTRLTVTFTGHVTIPNVPSGCTLAGPTLTCSFGTVEPDALSFPGIHVPLAPDSGPFFMVTSVAGVMPDPDHTNDRNTSETWDLFGNGPSSVGPVHVGNPPPAGVGSNNPAPGAVPAPSPSPLVTAPSGEAESTTPSMPGAVGARSGAAPAASNHAVGQSGTWVLGGAAVAAIIVGAAGLVWLRRRRAAGASGMAAVRIGPGPPTEPVGPADDRLGNESGPPG